MSLVPASKKIPAGICGILLGQFGVHKFIMGFPRAGLVMVGVTIVGYALACIHIGVWMIAAMHIIGAIEGIIYPLQERQRLLPRLRDPQAGMAVG